MTKDITEKAADFFNSNTEEDCYDFAVELLYRLQEKGFCIWQTYTKSDVECNIGRKPTKEEMQMLADSLQCFENIRNI